MQEDNLSILRSLKESIEEIVPHLEAAQAVISDDKTENVQNGRDFLMGELTMLVVMLTGSDSTVSARELQLLNAMRRVVYGEEIPELKSDGYLELCREFLRAHPESRMTVDHIPSSVRLLQAYDREHDTDYANKASILFSQFGEALVNADDNEHPMEAILLANFKEILQRGNDHES